MGCFRQLHLGSPGLPTAVREGPDYALTKTSDRINGSIHSSLNTRTGLHDFLVCRVQHVAAMAKDSVGGGGWAAGAIVGYVVNTFCEASSALRFADSTPHTTRRRHRLASFFLANLPVVVELRGGTCPIANSCVGGENWPKRSSFSGFRKISSK